MIRWYNTLKGDHGLLNFVTPTKDSLIVCHQGPEFRKFAIFNYHYLFGKYFLKQPATERCYYEVIQGQYPQKPYFDVDIGVGEGDLAEEEALKQSKKLIEDIKESILYDTRISESDILVFSSHGPGKLSYHIVVDNWCLPDYNSNKVYCNKIIDRITNPYKKYIDNLVYKSIQQFRTYGSTKRGKDRTKILADALDSGSEKKDPSRFQFLTILLRSFVSNTNSCKILEYSEPTKRVFSGPSEALSEAEMEIVKSLPLLESGDFEIIDVKDRLISLKRLKSSYCEICKREHQAENPYLIVTGAKSSSRFQIHFHCRRTKNDRLVIWEGEARGEARGETVGQDPSKRSPGRTAADAASSSSGLRVKSDDTKSSDQDPKIKTNAFIKKFLGKK